MYYIIGLGNPGGEYKISRHNTGRIVVENFNKKEEIGDFELNKKLNALIASGKTGKENVELIMPETYMNKSGLSLRSLITNKKRTQNLIVIHDDIDLPLGKFKISFARGSGGHKGVESVIKNIKTQDFIRIRVGISPSTPSGKLKKPEGKKMVDFIIGNFKPKEIQVLKKVSNKISQALRVIIDEGLSKAMSLFN